MSSFSNAAGSLLMIFTLFISSISTIFSIRYFLNKFSEHEKGGIFFIKMVLIDVGVFVGSLIVSFFALSLFFVGH